MASVAIALTAVTEVQAESFDLACTGKLTKWAKDQVLPPETFSERFRLDMSAGTWCRAMCEYVIKIPHSDSNEITLLDGKPLELEAGSNMSSNLTINRRTGDFVESSHSLIAGLDMRFAKTGSCAKEPFSGFPAQKF